jgi:hypothetical protein
MVKKQINIEPTIVDKYSDLIKSAKNGNIEGKWNIDQIYEIKRFIEKRDNRSYPIDWYCDVCLISLILKLK